MTLLDDFGYVDPGKITWKAPKGHKIDGASIPPVFWSFIGGPFEGKYRNASVVRCETEALANSAPHVLQCVTLRWC